MSEYEEVNNFVLSLIAGKPELQPTPDYGEEEGVQWKDTYQQDK